MENGESPKANINVDAIGIGGSPNPDNCRFETRSLPSEERPRYLSFPVS